MSHTSKLTLLKSQKDVLLQTVNGMRQDAQAISNYNYRHFFLRKVQEKEASINTWPTAQSAQDSSPEGDSLISQWTKEAEQLKRIVVVQNLYFGFEEVRPNLIEERLKEKEIK